MSIAYSCILLFLICISMHACHARHLGVVDKNKLDQKSDHFSSKVQQKISALAKVKSTSIPKDKLGSVPNKESDEDAHKDHFDNQKLMKNEKVNQKPELKSEKKVETSSAVRSVDDQSLVSVSWRVPHRKRGEKHPGFNLDYSPPKTHPPSHN